MTSLRRYGTAGLAAAFLLACGGGDDTAQEEPGTCRPVEGVLAADADISALVGDHTLTLVVTAGEHQGHSVEGTLTLMAHADSFRVLDQPGSEAPYYGSTDVDLEAVGALLLGATTSADPARPGVAVFRRRSAAGESQVTVRLGSNANRRDLIRFDGGYTVLRLTWVDGARFGGNWSSGVADVVAGGYFCAEPAN